MVAYDTRTAGGPVPLSEEELRLLEQMERALVQEDPKFASTLRGTTLRSSARRRATLAGVVFLLGIVVLMTGAIAELTVVGIIGFVIMLVSATYGLATIRGHRTPPAAPHVASTASDHNGPTGFTLIHGTGRASRSRRQSSGSFMERLEERWRRRREQGF
jgi:hypothetical protein